MDMNNISCCFDCIHPIDELGQCLIAKMFEKPINPEHGCSWIVPIKHKDVLTNGDRIRHMTDEELADWITDGHDLCDLCQFGTCRPDFECEKGVLEWLKQEVSEDAGSKTD